MQYIVISSVILTFAFYLFMIVIVKSFAEVVARQLHGATYKLFSNCDDSFVEKQREFQDLNLTLHTTLMYNEASTSQRPQKDTNGKESKASTRTKHHFTNSCRLIIENIVSGTECMLDKILQTKKPSRKHVANEILNILSFETAFKMSTLPPKTQWELLFHFFEDENLELFKELSNDPDKFDIMHFFEVIIMIAQCESKKM